MDVSSKRYRYTGMERDEETGLSLHGARYYACWLGRWVSGDPIGLGDGVNRYAYVGGNPVRRSDKNGNMWGFFDEAGEAIRSVKRTVNDAFDKAATTLADSLVALEDAVTDAEDSPEPHPDELSLGELGDISAVGTASEPLHRRILELPLWAETLGRSHPVVIAGFWTRDLANSPRALDLAQQEAAHNPFGALMHVAEGIAPVAEVLAPARLFSRASVAAESKAVASAGSSGLIGSGSLRRKARDLILGVRLRFGRPGPRPGKTTLFHQGDLGDTVDTRRTFSTSRDADLEHYNPEGELYRFDVDNSVLDRGKARGTILEGYDTHNPTGEVRQETRFLPNAVSPDELGPPRRVSRPEQ